MHPQSICRTHFQSAILAVGDGRTRVYAFLSTLLIFLSVGAQPCAGTSGAAQHPKKCFEIVSILVDACDGNNEGQNEMIRLDIGPADVTVASINVPKYLTGRVNWGANAQNPFLGFATYTATTSNKIKQLNQTIANAGNCGLLIALNGNGKLPAKSKALIITSEAFNPSAHDFSDLQDTLYVLLQKQGNTAGHFVNHSGTAGTRELILSYGSCGDTVEYDRTKLKKQNLSVGAEDGAVVDFTYNGIASYTNYGCRIPVPKIVVKATTPVIKLCGGSSFPVYGTVSGSPCYRWSLADTTKASIADVKSLNTQIRLKPGASGSVKVYLSAWGTCAKAKKDSVMVTVSTPPLADFTIDASASPLICFKHNGAGGGGSWRWGFQQSSDITTTNPRGALSPDSLTSSNPVCRYYAPGPHWVCLEVKDAAGCADTVCKSFVVPPPVVKPDSLIEIANVFTPSEPGDGYNDVFLVPCQGCAQFDLRIYNRWGEKVFQSKDPNVSWNGRVENKGPILPSGVYVYTLKYALGTASVKTMNGTVTLLGKP